LIRNNIDVTEESVQLSEIYVEIYVTKKFEEKFGGRKMGKEENKEGLRILRIGRTMYPLWHICLLLQIPW